ncbi:low molecular weight phosphatase family protein [Arthrobacter psychrolactophilus]|uniref:Low molecular weight phosphatase family protein n=1 Tax=Arthrobacter psychrolactophilus TaxID=92442 RepID=A0A2V5ISZ8_9MICC|nr:low molecular weight phosphatase family protein [Arthrobacter psychrolactophilus]PYI37344.1 low molecular weight phosphatase family protein [Arthrobacter psychrolactophilus]
MIHLLTVCTGNICRSPFAERMLQAEFDALRPGVFSVRSAGTESLVGHEMEAESAELLSAFNGSSDGFASRQLTPQLLTSMDMVLTMTVDHRDAVIKTSPRMLKRTYTLIEFARILKEIRIAKNSDVVTGTDADSVQRRWTTLPALAALHRSTAHPASESQDVIDPFRRSPEIHQQMVEEILPAIEEILAFERWCA